MNKNFISKCLIFFGLLLFFTFLPPIMPTKVSIAKASDIEKEKNNEARFNLSSITLATGKSFSLRVYNIDKDAKVSFRSVDSEIASITEDGVLTGKKAGSTTIIATIRRGINTSILTCDVKVGPPAFSVKLIHSRIIIGLDQSFLLEALIKPINTVESVKFGSKNIDIATVSPGGRVTAKSAGMTYVYARIDATDQNGENKSSSCSVIVIKPEDVAPLNEYFSLHPELSMISEAELSDTLFEFFNPIEKATDNTGSANKAPEDQKAQANMPTDTSLRTDNTAKATSTVETTTTPAVAANTTSSASDASLSKSTAATQNELSLVERLDKHLNSKYNLADLKQKYEERLKIVNESTTQLSSLYR